ncbi:hypothetical protein SAMN05421788_1052 [Filimonas lacunae]|uniref:Uncharacterized protein n=1 Tax=Filimonas lacunae TaxID=477680 RepID=A0A173MD83_9BACT|nr:hypothetical protein [Filimonas lacunae]BAV05552.1 hypothetical protein FLA_1559 [Filimonas lacunae]SIT20428.1 hypothetical protein SAMN05421788_1052 [Filimonas lacunae]
MKSYTYFVPTIDAQASVWAGNVNETVTTVGPQLGLTATEVSEVQAAAMSYKTSVELVEAKKRELENAVAAKNQSRKTDVQVIARYAARMKTHKDYTDALGGALGIVGTVTSVDPKDLRPTITPRVFPGQVEISFNLQQMVSISIYSRLKGTNGWEKLGNDKTSPYIDARPLSVAHQAEIREYSARYFDGKEDVGEMSAIETVVFGG